jgi:RimJ/RimL family protein N-acetyltransferase
MENEQVTEEELEQFLDELVEKLPPREEVTPWVGYEFPLACRELRSSDARHLFPVMKRSAKMLKGYIDWAKYAPSWDYKTVVEFVNDHVNSEYPRFHLIFTIGKEVVGFGSLAPMPNPRHIQVALWVGLGHQRRGIGHWILTVLEFYAFCVYGYDKVFYQHDATNRASGSLPPSSGYRFDHTFDSEIHASKESGYWFSWVKDRPEGLLPGFIDTGNFGTWHKHQFPWKCLI